MDTLQLLNAMIDAEITYEVDGRSVEFSCDKSEIIEAWTRAVLKDEKELANYFGDLFDNFYQSELCDRMIKHMSKSYNAQGNYDRHIGDDIRNGIDQACFDYWLGRFDTEMDDIVGYIIDMEGDRGDYLYELSKEDV